MEKFEDYLRQNIKQLKGKGPVKVNWFGNYNNEKFMVNGIFRFGNDDFKKIVSTLPHELSREDIFKYMKEDYYKGFVATLLWGGIGLGQGGIVNFKKAFEEKADKIKIKLKNVKSLLKEGEEGIKKAFKSMCPKGENKIEGIGISYFTKLLFFLSDKDMKLRPLIYDNQLQKVHAALMKDECDNLNNVFLIHSFSITDISTSFRILSGKHKKLKTPVDYYMDFIIRMDKLSKKIDIKINDNDQQGKVGRLEEIVFGEPINRNGNKDKDKDKDKDKNPRVWISNYLCPKYTNEASK